MKRFSSVQAIDKNNFRGGMITNTSYASTEDLPFLGRKLEAGSTNQRPAQIELETP